MITKNKIIIALITAIIIFGIGFFIGRSTIEVKTKTETVYVEMPPISGDIEISEPTVINIPQKPIWIYDTIKIAGDTLIQKVDTAAILHDWILERRYENTAFDNDTIGKMDIITDVQYNKIQRQSYTYIPIQKQTTTIKTTEKYASMFIMVGANNNNTFEAQIGTFIKGIGFSYEINYDNVNYNTTKYIQGVKVGLKF